MLLPVLLRYLTVIGFGRRSGPLLVGLATGGLLVGVVAVTQPAAVSPSGQASTPETTYSSAAPPTPASVPAPTSAVAPDPTPPTSARRTSTRTPATARTTARPPQPSPATPAPAKAATPAAGNGPTAQVVALTNQARAQAGCPALRSDARLAAAAQAHSADMAANDYFEHDGLDGRSFAERLTAQGYPSPGGENIAQGQQSAQEVVTAWLNSPGHRANIDNCSFTTIGVGLAGTDKYWTQDFGR